MIDENKLIEFLEKKLNKNIDYQCNHVEVSSDMFEYFQGKINILSWVINVIKSQPKVNEWIPVTEMLPEELEPVLVAYRGFLDKKIYSDDVAYIRCDDWVWNCDESDVIVEIVAWQPLPKPYKEKENE